MLFPILSTVLAAIGGWIFILISRMKNYSGRSRSTIELASGYNNISFFGLPLIMAFYGGYIAIICEYRLNTKLINLIIGISIVGFVTTGIWFSDY